MVISSFPCRLRGNLWNLNKIARENGVFGLPGFAKSVFERVRRFSSYRLLHPTVYGMVHGDY